MNELVQYHPIGFIHTGHTDPARTPIQPRYAAEHPGATGRIEILDAYAAGLDDLEGFSHVILLYHFHQAGEARLRVKPYLDDTERGIFATRAPCRPNPIGLSVVRLLRREGTTLFLEDLDILDGTPLLDIKPYVDRFDGRVSERNGWQEHIDEETAGRRGRRLTESHQAPKATPGRNLETKT